MNLTDKDGKPISTEGVDPKTVAFMQAAFAGLSGQVGGAINASIKPLETKLTESITTITASIESIKPAEGDPAKKTPQGNPGGDDNDNPVLAELKKLNARMDSVENQTKEEREAATASSLTQGFFDKHFPNLKGKDIIVGRISAIKPKDEDAIQAEFEKIKAEQVAIWGEEHVNKVFSADANAEGAKDGQVDDIEAENAAKLAALNAKGNK